MATPEISGMTDVEITEKVKAEKDTLNKMKMNHKISPIENPSKIRITRREIAKILTEKNNRKHSK
jgi:large subunit ribosomal protein L29